ncbi:MAG: methyltransferase domain-containing protein [Deltaproteobacteria bacterium]|nr:methyltransferase domain-containing protein [Deltaproteobacteria bacterium]
MIEVNQHQLPERICSEYRVLDVGGWHSPLNRADVVLDIMPYETRNQEGALLKNVWPTEHFDHSSYFQMDICKTPWPFNDKEFDFALCSHTLEDLRDPIAVCRELVRVAKAGYVETPSRIAESLRGMERPFYCGYYHHRWLCEVEGKRIIFQFKPAMLHAYRQFHFRKPWYKKLNPKYESVGFFWEGCFDFEERIVIDRNQVQQNLAEFKARYCRLSDLYLRKYSIFGKRI